MLLVLTAAQAAVAMYFDFIVSIKGPADPALTTWARVKHDKLDLAASLNPIMQFLFRLSDGTALPVAVCPYPWACVAMQACVAARASVPPELQVSVYATLFLVSISASVAVPVAVLVCLVFLCTIVRLCACLSRET